MAHMDCLGVRAIDGCESLPGPPHHRLAWLRIIAARAARLLAKGNHKYMHSKDVVMGAHPSVNNERGGRGLPELKFGLPQHGPSRAHCFAISTMCNIARIRRSRRHVPD